MTAPWQALDGAATAQARAWFLIPLWNLCLPPPKVCSTWNSQDRAINTVKWGVDSLFCRLTLQRKFSPPPEPPPLSGPTSLPRLPPLVFLVGIRITTSSFRNKNNPHCSSFHLPDYYSPFQHILKHLTLFRCNAPAFLTKSLWPCYSFQSSHTYFLLFLFQSPPPQHPASSGSEPYIMPWEPVCNNRLQLGFTKSLIPTSSLSCFLNHGHKLLGKQQSSHLFASMPSTALPTPCKHEPPNPPGHV